MVLTNGTEVPCVVKAPLGDSREAFIASP
jgi:hypothetical protein